MSDKAFALITVVVSTVTSGLFSLAIAIIISFTTSARENAKFRREAALARIERVQKLFDDAQMVLVRVGSRTKRTQEHEARELQVSAMLSVDADPEIGELYGKATCAYNECVMLADKGPVRQHEGFLTVRNTIPADAVNAEKLKNAEELSQSTHRELTKKMREQLAEMRNNLAA